MAIPFVSTWMEEANDAPGLRINAGNFRAFVTIAVGARDGEIGQRHLPAMLLGDNVIDF